MSQRTWTGKVKVSLGGKEIPGFTDAKVRKNSRPRHSQFWAVGLNFSYDIVSERPDCSNWGSIEGPFNTLGEAKWQIRQWIKSDRRELECELARCMALKMEDLR